MLRVKDLFLLSALGFVIFSSRLAVAYEISAVTDGAVITGKAAFKGAIPEAKKLIITKDQEVCGKGYVERREIEVAKNGSLKDVVVFLEHVPKGKGWEKPPEGFFLDQKRCAFLPQLLVIPRGAELTILNSDQILHNIHTYELIGSAKRTLFNIAQPKFKPKVTQKFTVRKGNTPVRIECDAHNWMLGWIFVADNPYSTVVGDNGSFKISDIPPGKYKLKVWHPFLGSIEREVNLSAKQEEQIVFEFGGK